MSTESTQITTDDFGDTAAAAAALAALDDAPTGTEREAAEQTPAEPAGEPATEAGGQEPAEGAAAERKPAGDTLADLMAKAEARRAERQATEAAAAEPKASPLTAQQLADAMAGNNEHRKAIEALKRGDLSLAAKLTGSDPASLFEAMTKEGLQPGSVSAEQELAALKAELAELKGAKPEGVMTRDDFAAWQRDQEERANVASFHAQFEAEDAAEKYPTLTALSQVYSPQVAQQKRLEYGQRVSEFMAKAGVPFTVETATRHAEELAAQDLSGLASFIKGAPAKQQGAAVSTNGAAADSATPGSKRAGRTIDNRAASESATGAPEPWDEDAAFARAVESL